MSILENDIPDIVYHYCSTETMMKIFESRYLLGSINTSMNDFTDSSWWYHILVSRAEKILNSENEKKLDEFINHIFININDYYINSFSKNNDILSQWRNYADDGRGVSIGFYTNLICKNKSIPVMSDLDELNKGWVEIKYDEEEQNRLADVILKAVVETDSNIYLSSNFTQYLLSCKNPAFIEENEIRYVEVLDSRSLMNPDCPSMRTLFPGDCFEYKYKDGKGIIAQRKHYYNINVENELKIHSITFGPKCVNDLKSFNLFANKFRINREIMLLRSKATYS